MTRYLLSIEFVLLCIALPTSIIVFRLAPHMFGFLWAATLYGYLVLRMRHKAHLAEIWKWGAVTWANMKPMLIRWVFASIAMLVFMYFYEPERMFAIIKERPHIVPFLLIMYPILSALPQEFVFCSFFFERYKRFFKTDRAMVWGSAIAFAYAHILYINWIAPLFSLFGGLIFATTYLRTKSLALVTIEHGLYGSSLFLIGLGWYFYSGAVPVN